MTTTALKAINGGSKQRNERKLADADKSIRPHCKVSIEDINWVRQQPPSVQQLWLDSVAAEQFGGSATNSILTSPTNLCKKQGRP